MCAEDLHKQILNCQSYFAARLWAGLLTYIECIPNKKNTLQQAYQAYQAYQAHANL